MDRQILIAIAVILLLTAVHSLQLISNICIGWDCPFYLYSLSSKTTLSLLFASNPTEPLYYLLMRPVAVLTGEITAVRIFPVVSFFVFLSGCYLLMRQMKFKLTTVLVCLVLLTFSIGLNRMWFDEYRNYLSLMFFPYFIYFFLLKKNFTMTFLLLFLMAISHRFFLLPLSIVIIYSLVCGEYLKKTLLMLSILMMIFIPFAIYFNFFWGKFLDLFVNVYLFPSLDQLILSVNLFIFFNSIFLIPMALIIFLMKRMDHFQKFFLALFVGLAVVAIIWDTDFGGRISLVTPFPAIFLIGMAINNPDDLVKENPSVLLQDPKLKLILLVLVGQMLLFAGFFGFLYLQQAGQNFKNSELQVLQTYDFGDGCLLTTSRLDYLGRWATNLGSRQLVVEWYDFTNPEIQGTNKILFYGLDGWKQLMGTRKIYILYSDYDTVLNQTVMQARIARGEIRVLYSKDNTTFGELVG